MVQAPPSDIRTVLVTGAAGFIGSHFCEALLARGCRVIGVDNFDDFYDVGVKRRNLSVCAANPDFQLIPCDVRDEAAIEKAMASGVDAIVHLAARAGVRPSIENPLLYQDVNVRGTAVVLETARKAAVPRIIFASSSSVYGNNAKVPFSETDPVDHPISPYAATKKAGELLCHAYHHLHDLNVTCLRFFTVYGARQRPDLAIHKFTRLMDAGATIPMFGDGGMMRDHTYVDDIVSGMMSALERCRGYHVYNLGESRPVSLRALIAAIEAALGVRAVIERLPLQPGDVERTYADVTRAMRDLDYHPRTRLSAGLEKFVAWYRAERSRG